MDDLIAYFTMEVGLRAEIPTYSGGLGVLSGDTIKSAADLNVPLCAVTLLHEQGYFTQVFTQDHWQQAQDVEWRKEDYMELLPNRVSVEIEGREIQVQAWKLAVKGITGHVVNIYFLDTNIEGNSEYDRGLTQHLYGGDHWYRMCQEIVLGIGGVKMLRSLDIPVKKYHMNEGHAAFLTLELRREYRKQSLSSSSGELGIKHIKEECVFTTHTPVAAGHDAFEMDWVRRALGPTYNVDHVGAEKDGKFNMTMLALIHSDYINGVAKKHGEVSSAMFPGFQINAITNGVHAQTWTSRPFQELFDTYIEGWREDNFMLRYSLNIPDKEIWSAHKEAKKDLISYVNSECGVQLEEDVLTIGFARRFATYKRADLVFSDMERLIDISQNVGKIQLIMSGKAHPHDGPGIEKIKAIMDMMDYYRDRIQLVFVPNYSMSIARLLVTGADVWLNTPIRTREASGTSGMKATLNGVLNFSVLDGWWLEGWVENVTGWSIGPTRDLDGDPSNDDEHDANELYEKLKHKIVPMYYNERGEWIFMMKHSISHNGSFFNTQRMVSQYVTSSWLV